MYVLECCVVYDGVCGRGCVHVHARTHACTHACVVFVCVRVHVCTCVRARARCMRARARTCSCMGVPKLEHLRLVSDDMKNMKKKDDCFRGCLRLL